MNFIKIKKYLNNYKILYLHLNFLIILFYYINVNFIITLYLRIKVLSIHLKTLICILYITYNKNKNLTSLKI